MGNKRFKHINGLRAKAMLGDKFAQKALEQALFVPHHLRVSLGIGRYNRQRVAGTHVTAKTIKAVPCVGTPTAVATVQDRVARLQMLKDRKERRDGRAAG